jgi:hypothetical protein
MIMVYTDRPAPAFWANYIPPARQEDVFSQDDEEARKKPDANKQLLEDRFKEKVTRYIRLNGVPDFKSDDIVWCGIRDWAREPHGGANHAWRPERKYWVVMRRLADIGIKSNQPDREQLRRQVCGEAYSDYHGFMEGSLRSAVYAIHRLFLNLPGQKFAESLAWLPGLFDTHDRKEFKKHLESLKVWVKKLDESYGPEFL